MRITKKLASKVLEVVDAGLVSGVGMPEPGRMCVEAAVCYAMGLPHGDRPTCVSPALRALKITLNDAGWSSSEARAKGLRRLAVVQLGSRNVLDDKEFAKRVATLAIKTCVPRAPRAAASWHPQANPHKQKLLDEADKCAREGTQEAAERAAEAAAAAARSAARADAELALFAEDVVQLLVDMKAPGAKWLALTEVSK